MNAFLNSLKTWLLLIIVQATSLLGNLVKILVAIITTFYVLFLLFPFLFLMLLGVLLFLTFAKLRQMLYRLNRIIDWLRLKRLVEQSDIFVNISANQSSKAVNQD